MFANDYSILLSRKIGGIDLKHRLMQHQLPEWSDNADIYVRALNMYRNSRKHDR